MTIVDASWVRADRRGRWGPRIPVSTRTARHPMTTCDSEPSVEACPAPRAERLWARGGEGVAGGKADEFPGVQAQHEVSLLQV